MIQKSMKKWEFLSKKNKFTNEEEIINQLILNRKIPKKEASLFFNPDLSKVNLELVGIDKVEVEKTIKRIKKTISKNKKIIIYGDYDVDGICGTAILWEVLYKEYKNVMPYIPHRVDEGYGLSIKGIESLISENQDIDLIITVDNGIVANDAVNFAKKNGIDVVISDHHVSGKILPSAFSIVHTTKLCGTGVAWMLAREFIKKDIDDLLELVALATVADLVPLKGANRILLYFGLKKIRETKRIGLLELFREAGIKREDVDTYEIGHIIAPRLNASGRIAHALDSLRLVCTKNKKRAEELAMHLGGINKERQNLTQKNTDKAKVLFSDFKETTKLIISHNEEYSQGVIGLVASRLVEEYYRPSIVIAVGEKLSKGSARSISGVNIIELIRMGQEYLVDAGGHPMAAGFTIETKKIEIFKEFLKEKAEIIVKKTLLDKILYIDLKLKLSFITPSLYKKLQQFAPFGMGNYEPVFASDVIIDDMTFVGAKKHLKFKFSEENIFFEGIGFGLGERISEFHIGDKVKIAYVIDENRWNGSYKLQLKIRAIKTT